MDNTSFFINSLLLSTLHSTKVLAMSDFRYLPPYLADTNTSVSNSYPWGFSRTQTTWRDSPDTGATRSYNFTVARNTVSPDGYPKPALLVNGQFPGPLIEANWGDEISVTVTNRIDSPEEGTLLHWHGLYQHETPWFDGVPAVDMCPIPSGGSLTYTFRADQYGTSWWHSHYDAQYTDGLFGPMVIYGPKNVEYDYDAGVVLIGAHYHHDYHYYIQRTSGLPFEVPVADNNLINGKNPMLSNCSESSNINCLDYSRLEAFEFQPGKSHRLRLINAGGDGVQRFSIDGHTMIVIANDFTPVVPYRSDIISLGVGQRTDIVVVATEPANSSWWIRSDFTTGSCGLSNQPHSLAAIYYPEADTFKLPNSTATPAQSDKSVLFCKNSPLSQTQPLFPYTPPENPATLETIEIVLGVNASNNTLFFMNGVSFRGNYNNPVLLLAKLGNITYPDDPEWNVYNFGSNSSVRLILINNSSLTHPIHLHGHNFWVLAEGLGNWDSSIEMASAPQRRDTQLLQGDPTGENPGYLVIEFAQDNPGVWPLHCHIAWHVSTGLYINVLERPSNIVSLNIPITIAQTCRDWSNFTGQNVVDQIDSGL